ncbi:MAG: ComEC/Rec2 family competence protein, partial [Eubacterium sp.]
MKRIFAHIGFSMAVCLIVLNLIEFKYVYVITAGLAIIFVASLVISKFRKALAVPVCLGSALFACAVFITVMLCSVNVQSNLAYETAQTQFYVTELPEKTDSGYVYEAKTVSIEENGAPQNIKIRIKSEAPINAQPYQVVSAVLTFYKTGDNAYSSVGKWGEGIYLTSKINGFYTVTDKNVFSLNKYILKVRKSIISTIKNNLGENASAVAIALLTGDKSYLPDDVYNYFKMAGATHIMAVSGIHLTVISGAFLFILKRLKVNDRIIAVLTILICIFCAGIAGFSKSVDRAAIMMCILMTGNLLKRRGDTLNSLGAAAAVMCLNPFAVSDVGAVLSVLSVLSLVTLYPLLMSKLNDSYSDKTDFKALLKNAMVKVIKSTAVSLCVTVFTLPAMYVFFGYVSIAGILSNILVVPLGSISMILSLAVCFLAKIPVLSGTLSFITDKIITIL